MNTTTTTATVNVINNNVATSQDLAVIEKIALDKLNKTAAKTDLDDLLRGARRSLLLLDCSSSMGLSVGYSTTRRIDALRKVTEELVQTHPVPMAAFGGSNQVEIVEAPIEPVGGTPLHIAIDFGREQGANHLAVVTDGEPDSESAAFAAARQFSNPIDVFYVGNPNGRGATFAKELAKMTGGEAHITTLDKPKELKAKLAGLLGDGSL